MRLLPYRRFTIETALAPAQVQARLRGGIEQERTFRFSKPTQPFTGSINGPSFDVMRNVAGRNSFRPRVRGTIEAAGSGTRVIGTMQLHEIIMVFIGAFIVAAGSVFLSGVARSVASRQLEPAMLIALAVLVGLVAMTLGGFFVEVRSSFSALVQLVDGSRADLQ